MPSASAPDRRHALEPGAAALGEQDHRDAPAFALADEVGNDALHVRERELEVAGVGSAPPQVSKIMTAWAPAATCAFR